MPDDKSPSAPVRSFWSGTITFGLVSIPVDLLAAARPRRKSMKLVDEAGHPLGRRYYCPKDDKVLDNDELVRGYQTDSGKMVVITDEEFASAAPEKSRDIELKSFVPLDAIPPSFFERPYFLAPDQRAGKAYALLAQTMEKTGKAGIGSFVMRSHEYLVAILARNGLLRAEVLRYADEVRTPEQIGLPKRVKPKADRVRNFAKEIEALGEERLDLSEMEDLEAEALRKFAERKAQSGKGVISTDELEDLDDESPGGGQVIDLMEVLRKSLGAKAAPAGGASSSGAQSDSSVRDSAAKNPPSRNTTAKKGVAKTVTATRKTAARKAPSKKAASKKVSSTKTPSKKASSTNTGSKKAVRKAA